MKIAKKGNVFSLKAENEEDMEFLTLLHREDREIEIIKSGFTGGFPISTITALEIGINSESMRNRITSASRITIHCDDN